MTHKLLHHKEVDNWMITGGCGTFDAVVWGKDGKASGVKQLDKPCHAELGAVSPYIIFPGTWSDQELHDQASVLVGCKMLNSGHVCASPQVVILDKGWPQGAAFVALVKKAIEEYPEVKQANKTETLLL